ncbi:MAG: hypothetical protein KatS3mg050_1579 [Litorilinea sp.]|nr:MAG: hypothetical protein KatS3mg050_1579 [Litorilinea sp.]
MAKRKYQPLDDGFEFDSIIDIHQLQNQDDEEDAGGIIDPGISLGELLHRLIHDPEFPSLEQLYALSDLSRQDVETVREHWGAIAPPRRREVIERLVSRAMDDVQLHLGRLLRIALQDEDPFIRRHAIDGLWEETEADLLGPFVHMLHNDPSTDVRVAAAAALGSYVLAGELDELDASLAMRAEEALLAVLHNEDEPVELRSSALKSLAYSGEAGVRQLIEDAYYSPYEEMRISALIAMGRSADIRWRGFVRAELQNPSPAMRVEAAHACGELEARAAVYELIALLEDEERQVRLASIFALGRLGGRHAREALEAMAASEDPEEAAAAEQALEEMLFYADPDGVPLFDESLEMDGDWDPDPWDGWFHFDDRDLGEYE